MDSQMSDSVRKKIIRDIDGNLINIGDWDYQLVKQQKHDSLNRPVFAYNGDVFLADSEMRQLVDTDGNLIRDPNSLLPVLEDHITNPLPEGAYEDEADLVVGPDGGLYLPGDSRLERTLGIDVVFARSSDEELEIIDGLMDAAPVRIRVILRNGQLKTGTDAWSYFEGKLTESFGLDRTTALLS